MKRFTLSLFSMLIAVAAMAQTTLLSSDDLNSKTGETKILLRNVSGTNGYWFNGVSSDAVWGPQNVFIWVPAADGKFNLKKAYPTQAQGEGFIQTATKGGNTTFGAAATAEPFVTVHPYIGGSGDLEVSTSGESWPSHAVMDNLVRFISQTTKQYLNVQNIGGPAGYRPGKGGYSFNNVYDVTDYYRLVLNITKDGATTQEFMMVKAGENISVPEYFGYSCDFAGGTMPSDDYEINIAYTQVLTTINEPSEFENKVYRFETSLGIMGASENSSNAISTAKTTVDNTDNDYFKWIVYTSSKGNRYLYNVGKKQFLGAISTANASIPMSETPVKVIFKTTNKSGYPIMFTTVDDGKCVVNHSTNYGEGLITWNGGWTDLTDNGNSHRVIELSDADEVAIAAIEALVTVFEQDNTEAVAELDKAIEEAEKMSTYIGEGVGKYTYTGDGNYEDLFAAIVEFRNSIVSNNNPSPSEVEAKTAELNALISSFSLNMPERGKYYRIKSVAGWNDDAPYLGAENYPTAVKNTTRAQFVEEADENTIFYLNDNGNLVSYSSGLYLASVSNFLCYNGIQTTGTIFTFTSAHNGQIGAYNVKFNNGNRTLYTHENNHTDAAGSTPGADNGYNFNIEEVTTLPVTVTEAGYATFFAPVEVTVPAGDVTAHTVTVDGEWASLSEALTTIPANTGVVLANAGTVELAINYAGTAEAIEGNVLAGTAAKSIISIENGSYYVLAKPEGAEVAGLYTPKNGDDKTTFINGSHKAYMHLAAQGAAYYSFRFPGTTGVEEITDNRVQSTVIYDLTGRRVEAITAPGIYIVNGVKRVVR